MQYTQAVDLARFIPSLQREVDAPGNNSFVNATSADWLGNLADAFWEARLDGLLQGYTCDDNGVITEIGATPNSLDDPVQIYQGPTERNWSADGQLREMVQLVVLYASFRVLRNTMRNLRTAFSATAGPVKFEYQQSATLLTEVMKDIVNRRNLILARLSDLGTTQVFEIDSIIARDESLMTQATYWVASGNLMPGSYGAYGYDGGYG